MNYFSTTEFCLSNQKGRILARAGDRLAAHHPIYDHIGTVNFDGRIWACSRKFDGVRLVNYEDFAGGQRVSNQGNVGNLSPLTVLQNYFELQGDGYDVVTKNCEHIDNYARGLGYRSKQLVGAGVVAATCLILAFALKRSTVSGR